MSQAIIYGLFGEDIVWKLYPLIVHLPLFLLLILPFRKKYSTVLASISLAYLCCQPSKWVGLLFEMFTGNAIAIWTIRILVMILFSLAIIFLFSKSISEVFGRNSRSVLTLSYVPLFYYVFDYAVSIYSDLWKDHHSIITEFLAFFLCLSFIAFCIVYYKEYEKNSKAEQKEQILNIILEQQSKEVSAIKQNDMETKLLRHDMRFFLNNLKMSIENDDKEATLKMISRYVADVEATSIRRYCKNDIINYILTSFESRCKKQNTKFQVIAEFNELFFDEIMFSSIISNALDNALNAQEGLNPEDRCIKIMLKDFNGKFLLSVKNTFKNTPVLIDGLPKSNLKNHGFGVQSIRFMTEKLGGNYQFSIQDGLFVLRVVLKSSN